MNVIMAATASGQETVELDVKDTDSSVKSVGEVTSMPIGAAMEATSVEL